MDIVGRQDGAKKRQKEPALRFGLQRQKKFLKSFATSCNIAAAAAEVGVNRSTIFWKRKKDAEFRAAFELAREQAVVNLESELIRRGIELLAAATPEDCAGAILPGMDAKFLLSLIQSNRRYIGKEPGHASEQRSDPQEAAARLHALMLRLRLQRAREEDEREQEANARDARRGS